MLKRHILKLQAFKAVEEEQLDLQFCSQLSLSSRSCTNHICEWASDFVTCFFLHVGCTISFILNLAFVVKNGLYSSVACLLVCMYQICAQCLKDVWTLFIFVPKYTEIYLSLPAGFNSVLRVRLWFKYELTIAEFVYF